MSNLENNSALFVAEQLMEYSHKKERQAKQRQHQYLEHKKEMRYSRKSVFILSGIAGIMLALCVTIIFLGMQVREREVRVESLVTEVSELRKENKEAEKRISNKADYQWVREEALKLGMSQVTKDRVIYYSLEDKDYMVQHEDIPAS